MKRFVKFLLFFLPISLILISLFIWGPKLYLKILQKRIDNISIIQTNIREHQLNIIIKVDISKQSLPSFIDSIRYSTEVNDTMIAHGVKRFQSDSIRKGSLFFHVHINMEALKRSIKDHEGDNSELTLHMKHFCHFPILGKRTINVTKHIHLKVPIIPEVKIKEVKVTDVGLDNLVMKGILTIDNPNNIDFTIQHIEYTSQVKDYAYSHGQSDSSYHIQKLSKSDIELTLHTDLKHEASALWHILKDDTEWPYHLEIRMRLRPSDSQINTIYLETKKEGKIDLSEALKKAKHGSRIGIDENK